jgi:hypothetical protein
MNNLPTPVIDSNMPAGAFPATLEQVHALGVTDAEIEAGKKCGLIQRAGSWQDWGIRKYRAITMHTVWAEDSINCRQRTQFWPARTLTNLRESGHQLEGQVSLGGRRFRGFTSSVLFELPDGKLIDVAVIFACVRD